MEKQQEWKPAFFTFWTTQALSLFGSGLASFAVVWWITESTGSATVLATASLAALVPGVLFGPLAGALVDRLNRKWVIILSDAASAVLALLLVGLFWTNSIQLWHIYVINVLRALAGAFQFPAVQSSTSLMVPQEQLTRVAGLNQALQGLTMIATPPLGALLLALLPMQSILGIDFLTAGIAISLLFALHIPQPAFRERTTHVTATVWQDMRDGFSFLKQWPALLSVMSIAALLNLVLTPAFTLVPILITDHFHGSALQLGWINAGYGLGIIGGGALLGIWGGFKRRIFTSLLGIAGLGIGSLLIGLSPGSAYGMALTGMILVGVMNAFANGPFFAILQSIIPPEMQGRVFTVLMSVSMGMAPVGLAVAGPLADRFGVQLWYLLGTLVCGLMVTWILLSPALLRLEEGQAPLTHPLKSATE
ncbi:MAG TPA: MFS transporter [Anaerolineales bacterium]|nr:MFS transporter [Anaerolineales bacterium]